MHFVFITGGVASSLGKGIASASLATLLKSRKFKEAKTYKLKNSDRTFRPDQNRKTGETSVEHFDASCN